MGLWIAMVCSIAVGLFGVLWPASPAAVRLATATADEPLWRLSAYAMLPFVWLSSIGWLMWWVETGDWRYGVIGLFPLLAGLINVPITLYRRRRARRQAADVLLTGPGGAGLSPELAAYIATAGDRAAAIFEGEPEDGERS